MKQFLLLAMFSPVFAGAATSACPPALEVRSTANAPAGWQLVAGSADSQLHRVGFFSGPPADGASLVPDKTQDIRGESRDTWTFAPKSTETIWLACFYHHTTLSLAKTVATGAKRCEVRYKTTRTGARLNVIAIQCE